SWRPAPSTFTPQSGAAAGSAAAWPSDGKRCSASRSHEHEPHAAPRRDLHVRRGLLELLAQPRHVHVDHVRPRIEMHVPHALEQLRARDHLSATQEKVLEELELLRGLWTIGAVHVQLPGQAVE